nr:solute carrier family 35 member G1-like [Lytechinus pictus]
MKMASKNPKITGHTDSLEIYSNGLVLAFLSGFAVSISSLMTKLARDSTFLQITFLRTSLICCSTLMMGILSGNWSKFRDAILESPIGTIGWLLVRSFSSFIAMTMAYSVYQRIPMGDASAIFGVTPVFTGIMGVVLLGEAWQRKHVYLTFLAWTGVALIYKPTFLSRIIPSHYRDNPKIGVHSDEEFYLGVAILVPLAASLSFVLSRKLSKTIPPTSIVCITSFGIMVYSCVAMAIIETVRLPPLADWKYLIPEVIAGLTSQTLFGKALQLERAAPVTLMRNSSIFFSFLFQFILFGTIPSWVSVLGASLVIVSTAILGTLR